VDNGTRWVGIDLHRRRSFVTAIDEHGEVSLRRRITNDPNAFLELLGDPEALTSRSRRPTGGSG
jgi:hypothetical protein